MEKVVKIILVNDFLEFLLQLRDNNPGLIAPGKWSFLGGGCQFGEESSVALSRELEEEIPGCVVENKEHIGHAYVEVHRNSLETLDFAIDREYLMKDPDNILMSLDIFKGRINHSANFINQRLREGQRTKYFGLEELKDSDIDAFSRKLIYFYLSKLFI